MFDRAAAVAIIAVVILFQPELRAALERFGRGRFSTRTGSNPVNEIMSAVRELATQKKGSLIAVEQKTPLGEFGKVGTPLDAQVSGSLLQTIFDSKGPLHDGGVIISGDVITYAAAVFPLSDKHEGWSIKHGTRHRAALGLAEVTDALVIVISEERGTVSIAQSGVLKSDIAPADVRIALQEIYG